MYSYFTRMYKYKYVQIYYIQVCNNIVTFLKEMLLSYLYRRSGFFIW